MNYRKSLNIDQLKVLELLYKFRFGSNDLFAKCFGKRDRSFVYKRLQILLEQGLIGKRFDGSYRLRGKPAAYYLLPDGVRALQEARPSMAINIKMIYKNKSVSEEFIEYCLALFGIYCQMRQLYGDALHFSTKHQLAGRYDYFDDFVPGSYMRLDGSGNNFFLEYLESAKPWFVTKRRIAEYIDYADSGEWEDATDSSFPKVLFICDKSSLRDRLLKKSAFMFAYADDELFFVSAINDDTWFDLADPETKLISSPI